MDEGKVNSSNKKSIHLFLIDIQEDFHLRGDGSESDKSTPLGVVNSYQDAERVVNEIILPHLHQISDITITLDTHSVNDISHRSFWVQDPAMEEAYAKLAEQRAIALGIDPSDVKFEHPPHPLVMAPIEVQEFDLTKVAGITFLQPTRNVFTSKNEELDLQYFWVPADRALVGYCEEYLTQLKKVINRADGVGKLRHMIWPNHCLQGTSGHNVVDVYHDAIRKWSEVTGRDPRYIFKGSNRLCEMYSGLRAEVPVASDRKTFCNVEAVRNLRLSTEDREKSVGIVVAGQAIDFSVRFTVLDLVRFFDVEDQAAAEAIVQEPSLSPRPRNGSLKHIHVLTNGCSHIFEAARDKFIADLKDVVTFCETSDVVKKLAQ